MLLFRGEKKLSFCTSLSYVPFSFLCMWITSNCKILLTGQCATVRIISPLYAGHVDPGVVVYPCLTGWCFTQGSPHWTLPLGQNCPGKIAMLCGMCCAIIYRGWRVIRTWKCLRCMHFRKGFVLQPSYCLLSSSSPMIATVLYLKQDNISNLSTCGVRSPSSAAKYRF